MRLTRFAAVVTALSLAAAPLGAEAPASLSKTVEVVVTNVDVVVLDRKGNPVTDLKPEDFVLKEDGVTQLLTHIALVDNGPSEEPGPEAPGAVPAALAAPPVPKVHLVLFLDQLHLTAGNRNRALESLSDFITKAVGPRVEAQVITWDRAVHIRGRFTSDPAVLADLLQGLRKESAWGDQPVRERDALVHQIDAAFLTPAETKNGRASGQDVRDVLIPEAAASLRGWCERRVNETDTTLAAVRSAVASLAGVEGRKLVFLVTEGLTSNSGREMWDYFRNSAMTAGPNTPGVRPMDVTLLNASSYDRMDAFKELARVANASGTSLVTVEAGGLNFDTTLSAQFAGSMTRVDDGMAKLDSDAALKFLADQTGGSAVLSRNNMSGALAALETGWRTYYSLGFESANAKPGRERALNVTVKRPGVIVRSRRSLVERTWEQKIADAVLSGIYFPRTHNPLGATLNVGVPVRSGNVYVVPLEFSIPFEYLALIPSGKVARGRILLTVAAATADGQTSEISTQRAPIEVPEIDLEKTQGKPFVYATTLRLKPGPQIVSLALTDELTQITSYVQPGLLIGDRRNSGKP